MKPPSATVQFALGLFVMAALQSEASLVITAVNQNQIISFDSTTVGVNSGQFNGSGITGVPSTGQLGSTGWATTGWSDGNVNYGGTATIGDHARGVTTSAVTTPGIYAYGTTDRALLVQPGNSDFDPGTITLRITNNTGQTISKWNLGYEAYLRNDSNNESWMRLELSNDSVNWLVPILQLGSGFANNSAGSNALGWQLSQTHYNTLEHSLITVPDGGNLYMRWHIYNASGSLANPRDEWGIDDITVGAVPEPKTLFLFSVGFGIVAFRRARKATNY